MAHVGPTVKIEIDGVFVDITSRVRYDARVRVERTAGWQARETTVQPGTLAFTCNNRDDYFSYLRPGTTNYGKIGVGTRVQYLRGAETRFEGELSSPGVFGVTEDSGGRDPWVQMRAAGAWRRFTVGNNKPLRSAAYRALTSAENDSTRLAYWSLEEESGADQLVSPYAGTEPIGVAGEVSFGAYTASAASARMVTFGAAGLLFAKVPRYTITGETKVTSLWRLPDTEPANGTALMRLYPGGTTTIGFLDLIYGTGGLLSYNVYVGGSLAASTASTNFGPYIDGVEFMLSQEFTQAGADVTSRLLVVSSLTDGVLIDRTISGQTFGRLDFIAVAQSDLTGTSFGQLAVGNDTAAFPNWINHTDTGGLGTLGYPTESGAGRIQRLCDEEGVTAVITSVALDADGMGVQQIDTLPTLCQQAQVADGGMLYDARDQLAIAYIDRYRLSNRYPTVTLDWGDLSPPTPQPIDDDALLHNDVTIERQGGGQARYVIPDGDPYHYDTRSPAPPGSVGTYDQSYPMYLESDDLAGQQAAWYAHLGAIREPRYSTVSVDLARSAFIADPAKLQAVLDLDIGSALQITEQPTWCPADPIDLLVYGYTEVHDQFQHEITFRVAPARPWEVWSVETGGSELVVAIDSDDVSLKAATTLGPEWSTTAEPYYWSIDGEVMTVTALTTDTPAYIAAGAIASGNNASITPALPAGITADVGQSLWIFAAIRGSGTATVDTPAGWENVLSSGNIALLHRYYVTGVTAPLVTFTGGAAGDDTQARMFAFSGLSREFASGTLAVPAGATQLNGSATNVAYPELAVNRDGGVILYLFWRQDDATSFATVGDAEIMDNAATAGNDQHIAADYDIYTTATDVASGSVTVTTGGGAAISRAMLAAFRPLQTATVTRAVNGVSASHAANAAIHVWRPGAVAL